jgi:energy-coupling factor transporter ATP-binding protein EcfA2
MNPVIELKAVKYYYPDTTTPSINIDELKINQGEFICLVGRTGAGKTTLCRLLVGLVPHSMQGILSGEAKVMGLNVLESEINDLSAHVGIVMDDPFDQLTKATFSVREEIAFGLQNAGMPIDKILEKVEKVMHELGISHLADRLPTELSGGQQQRVAIASIFVGQPEILVLDEATSQLDPQGSEEIYKMAKHFKEIGKTVIMVEPKLDKVLQHADRLLVMNEGSIVASGTSEDVFNSDILQQLGLDLPSYPKLGLKLREKGYFTGRLPINLGEAKKIVLEAVKCR